MQALAIFSMTRYDIAVTILAGLCTLTATILNVHVIYISKKVLLDRFWLKVKSIRKF